VEEVAATKKALGWPTTDSFFLPPEAVDHFRQAVGRGANAQQEWQRRLEAYRTAFPEEAAEWDRIMTGRFPPDFAADLPRWNPGDKPVSTRVAAGQALNALAQRVSNIIGGSADLNPSTNTALKDQGDFQAVEDKDVQNIAGAVGGTWSYAGRNVAFGVREHAMGAAVNGMAAHGGIVPFSATFLVFSDYMKPAIRLGSIMGLRVIYVFTHDSIAVGEDGPTHEPIGQVAGLRAIPGLTVIRPADANEAAEAWAVAIQRNSPTLLALTRQNLSILDRSRASEAGVARGGYILSEAEGGKPQVLLIGTGSEVELCIKAQARLKELDIQARVVSLPSWELFAEQDRGYREQVLPGSVRKRVTVEAGATFGWERFTAERITAAALRLLGRQEEADREEPNQPEEGEAAVAATSPAEGHS
jgi:transketolase